nr:caspase family protein [Streptomyces canus]
MSRSADDLPDIVAERTYALVVGVESYDEVSTDWRLPGAARDAVNFTRWITGPGRVPSANVRLFLSPLPENRLADHDGLPEVQPAFEADIKKALFRELPAREGDLLWIYWAGHGFMDERKELLLPYADATVESTSHLNLESALRWWSSTSVNPRLFGHQVAVVDACRVDYRGTPQLAFGNIDYGRGALTGERRQFVLYAARPGETAKNEPDRGSGLFTRKLLDTLGDMSVGQSIRDLPDATRRLQADFDELREGEKAWQTPTFEIHRGWNGSALLDDPWAAFAMHRPAPTLDQAAWHGLEALTKDRGLPPHVHDAYRWAFRICGCAAPADNTLPPGGLTDIVHDLDERQGRPGRSLTLAFVHYLAAHCPDRDWGARLASWADATRERIGAEPVPAPPQPPTEPAALHVQLTKAVKEDTYLVRIWHYRDGFTAAWDSGTALVLTAARDEIGEQVAELVEADAVRDPLGDDPDIARVEFHVPLPLVEEEFESWAVPTGPGDGSEPMGFLFEVVVRCPDERKRVGLRRWLRKWQSYERHGGGLWEAPTPNARHPVWLLADDRIPGNLSGLLQLNGLPVCVLAPVAPALLGDALTAVHKAGIPIVLWRRGGAPSGSAGDLATVLASPDAGVDLRNLPGALRRLRVVAGGTDPSDQDWSHPLVLLWDDPHRRLPPRPLK